MEKKMISCLTVLSLTILIWATLGSRWVWSGVQDKEENVYEDLYDRERFDSADTNHDGILDKNELRNAQKDFEYYQDNSRLQHADTNNDGVLSFKECKAERSWEEKHNSQLEKEAFQDLKKKYPNLDPSDRKKLLKLLKNNPDKLRDLLGNKSWIKKHSDLAVKITEDKDFIAKHPDIAQWQKTHQEWVTKHQEWAKSQGKGKAAKAKDKAKSSVE